MNKTVFFALTTLALGLSACQNDGDQRIGAQAPIAQDFSNQFETAPFCADEVITSYNRVLSQSFQFAATGRTRHLKNLMVECSRFQGLMRGSSCLATEQESGDLMLVSSASLSFECDQGNAYTTNYDRGQGEKSSRSERDRRRDFKIQGEEDQRRGIGKASSREGRRHGDRSGRSEGRPPESGPRRGR